MGKQGTPNRLVDQTSPYLLQRAYNARRDPSAAHGEASTHEAPPQQGP
jgi:hypothetical protein